MESFTLRSCVSLLIACFYFCAGTGLHAADCNGNGVDDTLDLVPKELRFDGAICHEVTPDDGLPKLAVDLDADGDMDSVTSDATGVLVHLNRGDGTFADPQAYSVPGSLKFKLIASDLDNDHATDLAILGVTYSGEGHPGAWISVLYNNGDGTFQAAVTDTIGGYALDLLAADLNGDGLFDLAAGSLSGVIDCSSQGGVWILLNKGNRIFEVAEIYHSACDADRLMAVDLDSDGDIDIVAVSDGCGPNTVFLNAGDGTFQQHLDVNAIVQLVGDFNGDGMLDIVATVDSTTKVYYFDGDSSFSVANVFDSGNVGFALAADLDNDGDLDLVGFGLGLEVALNNNNGTFSQSSLYEVTGSMAAAADIDGDGILDLLVTGYYTPVLSVLLNQGDGSFKKPVNYALCGLPTSIDVADRDGDGSFDVAVRSGAQECVLLNFGNGVLHGAQVLFTEREHPMGASYFEALDFDRDGDIDLLMGYCFKVASDRSECRGVLLINSGHGDFDIFVDPYRDIPDGTAVLFVDLNADGNVDLVTGGVMVQLSKGDGTSGEPLNYAAGGIIADGYLTKVATGDFDGNGTIDIAVAGSGGITVLFSNTVLPASLDLNHNGIPDECETRFHRGDPNSSGETDISDGTAIFGFLFLGEPSALSCKESADANNDGAIDISDGIYLLRWLFTGGTDLPAPGPTGMPCDFDPDPPGSPGDLGCESYSGCK